MQTYKQGWIQMFKHYQQTQETLKYILCAFLALISSDIGLKYLEMLQTSYYLTLMSKMLKTEYHKFSSWIL